MTQRPIRDGSAGTLAEIKRMNRKLSRLSAQEQMYRDMLTICDNQTDYFKDMGRVRDEMVDAWKMEYRKLAVEYRDGLEVGQFDESEIRQLSELVLSEDGNLPISEKIRRLDKEAEEIAILGAELGQFIANDEDLVTVVEEKSADSSSVKTAENIETQKDYIEFVIVDERGQPLGRAEKSEKGRPQSSNGYITIPAGSMATNPDGRSSRSSSTRGYPSRAMRISGNGISRTARRHQSDRQRRAKDSAKETNRWQATSKEAGEYWPENGSPTGIGKENATVAYSVLNDQNEFVMIPVLKVLDDQDIQENLLAGLEMTVAQRMWQHELNASGGRPTWYTIADPSGGRRADSSSDQLAGTSGQPAVAESGRVPRNVQRSLLHRVLVSPPMRLKDRNEEGEETKPGPAEP